MLTLEDILWGKGIPDNSGDGTSGDTGDGGDIDPTAMLTNCLAICCTSSCSGSTLPPSCFGCK